MLICHFGELLLILQIVNELTVDYTEINGELYY